MPDGSFTMAQGALSSKAILGAGIPKGRSHGPFAVKMGSGFRVEMLEQRSCLISRVETMKSLQGLAGLSLLISGHCF